MRTFWDRVRHAISFEIIGLLLVTPLGALVFHLPLADVGVVSVVSATVAMVWNAIYNFVFDLGLRKWQGSTLKTVPQRIGHAVLFELGLLLLLLPFIAWYLGISLLAALIMDIAFALFYMAYAFVFNLAYDKLFPLPEWQTSQTRKNP